MNNFCIIFTASDPFPIWHRRQFVKQLSHDIKLLGGKILCIEPPVFSVYTLFNHPKRILEWLKGKSFFRLAYNDNIFAFTPITLEHIYISDRFKPLLAINKYLLRVQLRRYLKKMNASDDKIILMLHRPEVYFVKDVIKGDIIYDAWDEFTVPHDSKKYKVSGNVEKERLFAKDSVFIGANSSRLLDKLIQYNCNTVLLEPGWHKTLFTSVPKDYKIPELDKLKKPIIGYVGMTRNWMDFSLIEYLLRERPNWTFLFAGTIRKDAKKVVNELQKKYSNLICTGTIKYTEFPVYLKYLDVGIIPFKINDFTLSVNPNKLYEYLGMGVPVVSTGLDHLKRHFSNVTRIADSREEFLDKIEEILSLNENDRNELLSSMEKVASDNTWEKRTEYFVGLLQKYIFEVNKS